MTDKFEFSQLSVELQARIEDICEQFELAWQQGQAVAPIDDLIRDWQDPERSVLHDELLQIESKYRQDHSTRRDDVTELSGKISQSQAEKKDQDSLRNSDSQRPNSAAAESIQTAGSLIGPYRLVEKLGEGGMGEVWLAEQQHPVKRQVALKVIKAGFDSREIIARFEAERQALALMDHPNVARIIDAGTTDADRPFFAMELVRGEPLNQYCDRNRLSIGRRLRLFNAVCSGVQHAHQKGIIHRDLKPGNIMVVEVDGRPVPKVIDFGLAKAMDTTELLTDKSLHTEIGRILGTLKYMSPEQAGLESRDIDIRTDVYSLGVILYELLTGSTPLDDPSLKGQAILSVLATIREQDPVKPSSRLSHSGDSATSITGARRTDTGSLHRILAGDLDWVVMKALEKDRPRRYDSVSAFAADIRRYLDSEPVIARPPSLNYRVRKFVRKNRVGVLAAALVTLALIGGIVGTSWAMFRAMAAEHEALDARQQETTQRELAEARRLEAEQERELAESRRQEAERNLTFAKKGNEILGSVFSGLDPKAEYATVAELRDALRDNLEHAVAELNDAVIGDSLALAEMQLTLGRSLLGLGQFNQGIVILERAVEALTREIGPDHPDTLTSMNELARGYNASGQSDKAILLHEQTLERRKVILGPDHPDTLTSMNNLAAAYRRAGQFDEALPLLEQNLELVKAKLGPDHVDTLSCMNSLAACYSSVGRIDQVLLLCQQILELRKAKLGVDHPSTLVSMRNLAATYRDAGQLDLALPLYEQTVALSRAKLGVDHPDTLTSVNALAVGYHSAGQLDRALPMYEHTLELMKVKLGLDHPDTLRSMSNLAGGYMDAGQLDLALPLFEQTLKLRKAKLGLDHPDTLRSMNSLASVYHRARQFDLALPVYEQALEMSKNKLGPEHPQTLRSMHNLASGYKAVGQLDRALPLLEQTLELRTSKLGLDHPDTLRSMNDLAGCYWSAKQPNRSVSLLEELLPIREKKLGRQHPDTLTAISNLGFYYRDTGRVEEAIPLLEEVYAIRPNVGHSLARAYLKAGRNEEFLSLTADMLESARSRHPAGSFELAAELVSAADLYLQASLYREAVELLREGCEIRNEKASDVWSTFNAQSMLGGCLLELARAAVDEEEKKRQLAEAEPLLLAGYEGMKQREAEIPSAGATRISAALDRLAGLYEALDQPDEEAKYRELRAAYSDDPSESEDKK